MVVGLTSYFFYGLMKLIHYFHGYDLIGLMRVVRLWTNASNDGHGLLSDW